MEFQDLVLELELSDNMTLEELKEIYTLIKYIPWNEKEINEIKRVHTTIVSRHNTSYDPKSFHRDVTKMKIKTPYPRNDIYSPSLSIPIPKIMKKAKRKN